MDADAVTAYLARIGHAGSRAPTIDTLRALHRAHLHAVPFENLDVHAGRLIRIDREAFFRKIVGERRGGFCYELNGLFADLLPRPYSSDAMRLRRRGCGCRRGGGSIQPAEVDGEAPPVGAHIGPPGQTSGGTI